MCTSIVEITAADGMAKAGDGWFPLTEAVVAYDHARHALLEDAITIDFINRDLPPGARAAVELTLDSAKALRDALERAIAAAEIEEDERRRPHQAGQPPPADVAQLFPEVVEPVSVRASSPAIRRYASASGA